MCVSHPKVWMDGSLHRASLGLGSSVFHIGKAMHYFLSLYPPIDGQGENMLPLAVVLNVKWRKRSVDLSPTQTQFTSSYPPKSPLFGGEQGSYILIPQTYFIPSNSANRGPGLDLVHVNYLLLQLSLDVLRASRRHFIRCCLLASASVFFKGNLLRLSHSSVKIDRKLPTEELKCSTQGNSFSHTIVNKIGVLLSLASYWQLEFVL